MPAEIMRSQLAEIKGYCQKWLSIAGPASDVFRHGNPMNYFRLSAVFHKSDDVFYPAPTLALPLKGREIIIFLPLQGGGRGMGGNGKWHRVYEKER